MALSKKEIEVFVAELVEEKLKELLGDPEAHLPLKPSVRKRLLASFEAEERGEIGVPAKAFAKKLGLEW